jgi:Bacterial type II/III secretion system short domain
MRAIWICLLLLVVMPVRAEEKSEVIPLRYLPAVEMERYLMPRDGPFTLQVPLPMGLLAWTVDARQNTLTVAGSPAAIQELKEIIRLLDVPPLHLQLLVRRFRTDAAAIAALNLPPGAAPAAGAPSPPRAVVLSPGHFAGIETRQPVEAATLDTMNYCPVRISQTGPQQQPSSLVTVVPHVNEDKTVTLMVSMSEAAKKPGAAAIALPSPVIAMARVPEGGAVLLIDADSEAVLLVRVHAILTPPDFPAKGE